jgi:tRNA threonylcarbamoyladenosine biosynthesis protein TsaB
MAFKELNDSSYSHGENLHVFIENLIRESNISFSDIEAIAVSKGPGSYTGLRIGVSSAKGLSFSLDKPLVAVDTLGSLARSIEVQENEIIIPLLDARRMEVYSAVFNADYVKIRETKAEVIDENSFQEYLKKGKVYFLGDGAEKCKEILTHRNAIFLNGYFPSAKQMAKVSYEKYNQNDIEDVAYFEPFYLKDFLITKPKNRK